MVTEGERRKNKREREGKTRTGREGGREGISQTSIRWAKLRPCGLNSLEIKSFSKMPLCHSQALSSNR